MCGIVGIFDLNGESSIDRELLHKMNETQFHRGPDEGGLHIEPGIGLGHRRLSIIDLSSGKQPLFNSDGSIVIVFNGEIYNYHELTKILKLKGYIFKTHSDTETIVHAWEEWGEACVNHFRGMFAFAIWDRNQRKLFLARDRLGKKPLHYTILPNGQFIFASELKALYQHPSLIKELDPEAVEDYFALGYVAEPKCIYKNIYKLPAAHTLSLKQGRRNLIPRVYWDVPFQSESSGNEQEIIGEFTRRFRESVDIRMESEVPLGAFLSGGVDSSSVVAMMAQLSGQPVNTCSIAFDSQRYNESEFAQLVADRYQTQHYVETVKPNDLELVDKLAGIYDEPYADSSAIPTYRVCELARKHVTVALSGDGADEYLSGYRRHQWHMNEEKVRAMLPYSLRKPVFGLVGSIYPKLDWAPQFLRAKTTFQALAKDSVSAYFHTMCMLPDNMRQSLYSTDLKQSLADYCAVEVFRQHAEKCPTQDPLSLIQYIDMKTYLIGDIHTKVDRASMANSLEVRAPLLDHELIEWVSGVSPTLKLRGQEGKYLLKKAMEPHVPYDTLYRKKMGFSVPLAEWFRGPLKDKLHQSVLGENMRHSGLFNMATIEGMVNQHQKGLKDYSAPLWSLLMFESFLKAQA